MAENPDRRLPKDAAVAETERVVFDPKRFGLPGEAALAWRFRIDTVHVFVDARDAHVILSYDDRQSVLNRITHDCKLTATCPIVLNETTSVVPSPLSKDAKDAHSAFATVHAYFKKTFARDGFDDVTGTEGSMGDRTFVQVPNFPNAQWLPANDKFEFGAGWTTLDIAAHLNTPMRSRALGQNRGYFGESGAVNEFFWTSSRR